MNYFIFNEYLIVVALVYILVRCLRSYAFDLDVFALFIDLIAPLVPSIGWEAPVIDFKSGVSFFVYKSVCKALVYVYYPIFLKSLFYNCL
jgi:hypothetical protein